jgi:hypothetical protein
LASLPAPKHYGAKRHGRYGTNELGHNSAGKRNPGRANLVSLLRLARRHIHVHHHTFAAALSKAYATNRRGGRNL